MSYLEFDEFFWIEYQRCQERAYMITKRSSRKVKIDNDNIVSFKFLKYVPYDETLQYIILKKIYFKSFDYMLKKGSLNLAEFKKIFITILEKEIVFNKKKFQKQETHYNSIRNKLLKKIEGHYNNLVEIDALDYIYKFSNIKIDLKKYLKSRMEEIKDSYKKNIPEINFEELENVFYKQDFLFIQKNIDNSFNFIMTSPNKTINDLIHKNCIIGTIIRYLTLYVSKELDLKFKNLIIYYPLELKREIYNISNIFNYFQDIDWIKVLLSIKYKLTITTNNNEYCKYCENSLMCFTEINILKEKYKNKKGGSSKTLLRI